MSLAIAIPTPTPPDASITYVNFASSIDFPRPRNREDIMEDPKYYELRNTALDFLYNRFAHDDVD